MMATYDQQPKVHIAPSPADIGHITAQYSAIKLYIPLTACEKIQ